MVALQAASAPRQDLDELAARYQASEDEVARLRARIVELETAQTAADARFELLSTLVHQEMTRMAKHRLNNDQWRTWQDERTATIERRTGIARQASPLVEGDVAAAIASDVGRVKTLLASDPTLARELAQHAADAYGDHPAAAELRFLHGRSLVLQAKWNLAADVFHTLIETHADTPWAGPARLELSRCLQQLGDTATAMVVLEDLVRLHPGTPAAAEAAERLSAAESPQ